MYFSLNCHLLKSPRCQALEGSGDREIGSTTALPSRNCHLITGTAQTCDSNQLHTKHARIGGCKGRSENTEEEHLAHMKGGAHIKEGFLQEMPPKLNFEERTGISQAMRCTSGTAWDRTGG